MKIRVHFACAIAVILLANTRSAAQLLYTAICGTIVITPNGDGLGGPPSGPGSGGVLEMGQTYDFQINNATGNAGPIPDSNGNLTGWSVMHAVQLNFPTPTTGNLTWAVTSTPGQQFDVSLQTLLNPTMNSDLIPAQGPMANFDPTLSYTFPIIQFAGTYTGPTSNATLNADTVFDYTNFANPHPGTFGVYLTVNSPAGTGGELDLVYTGAPVPEPGTLVLTLFALVIGFRAKAISARLAKPQLPACCCGLRGRE